MFDNQIAHHLWGRPLAMLIAALLLACGAQLASAQSAQATTYYVSPGGNDGASGASTTAAWKTFARSWQTLQPGDTLLLMDGVYYDSIAPVVHNGKAGNPITVRALNDGKAIIDGQGQRVPVQLGENWGPNGKIGDYYVVEGIIARNGTTAAILVYGSNNVLRRVSAYNADVDDNTVVVWLIGSNNLVEDAVAAGTGRYMFNMINGSSNTIRRSFAMYGQWDGRKFCGVQWPHGYGFGVYNTSNNTLENVISYGHAPAAGIMVQANSDTAVANNNQVLGSMALLSGAELDGSISTYGAGVAQPTSRPGPTDCTSVTQWSWGTQRVGILLWGQGTMQNNVFRDVLASGNVGVGFASAKPFGIGDTNTTLDHATLYGNGLDIMPWEAAQGGNAYIGTAGVQSITNSRVANTTLPAGEGARFNYRYVNRTLTATPLWPWPMEGRIQSELGLSVRAIAEQYYDVPDNPGSGGGGETGGSFDLTVTPDSQMALSNNSFVIKAKVQAIGSFAKPVQISVSSSASGLQLEPGSATISAPGQATFQVTTGRNSGAYVLTFTGHAEGSGDIQRQVTILVNPQPLFLPLAMR